MQKAESQHGMVQRQPSVRQGGGVALESPQGERIAQLEAMVEASPQSGKLAQLSAMANNSPGMVAQRKAISAIHNSPNVTAQRQQLDKLAGEAAQREEAEEPLQPQVAQREAALAKPNNTGLPDNLKNGIETLSGMSMDNVKVHYNSSQPAQLNALAYAQGTDIHVAPGQEQHLPHEAWHVVQQAQGRVKPTMQMKDGVPVNDDQGLEHEADVMGKGALGQGAVQLHQQGNVGILEQPPLTDSICVRQSGIENRPGPVLVQAKSSGMRVIQRQPPHDPNIFTYTDSNGLVWSRDENEQWYRPGDKQGDRIYFYEKHEVDLDEVAVQKGSSDVTLKEIDVKELGQQGDAAGRRAYIGNAIVWTGEANASGLAEKYADNSQDWGDEERKARLAVSFGINNRAEFNRADNAKAEQAVRTVTAESFNKTKNKITTYTQGWTWGYHYNKGNLPKSDTETVGKYLETGMINGKSVLWRKGAISLAAPQALAEFQRIRSTAGAPYGALRSKTGKKTEEIENHLKTSNHASEAYVHSIDADAPDFSTLKEGDGENSWKKVLDAYDEILEAQGHDVVIGGYNLLADPEKYQGKDYLYTVQSNVVDLAIRQAVHQAEPLMTYPTEPNFIIKASKYTETDKASGKSNVWGSTAYEGRNFIDNYIKKVGADNADIHYDALASIATGVDKGGARLKIETGKKYDKDSVLGKPQAKPNAKKGDTIPMEDQYIVQAQSWAGASRIAAAFRSAYKAKSGGDFSGTKDASVEAFEAVERMVAALVSKDGVDSVSFDVSAFDQIHCTDSRKYISVDRLLRAIKARLLQLEENESFWSITKG
ncbi:MAG: DUF4157 domain-containing protein [Gallionella sp.]|nr:DUF4157 domain-containing protein [Gallionella sp.]MCK9352568.1 DUF4157 domain-containing protein [Gallionella sp.]